VADAGNRAAVVHQFADVGAALPHAAEPHFGNRSQVIRLIAQPSVDRGIAFLRL
jgi:hypothetical protein